MGDDKGLGIVLGLGLIIGGLIGFACGVKSTNATWQERCVKNGLAMYSPDTAAFVLFKADEIGHAPAADDQGAADAGGER